jgi:hypothetical protein
VAQVTVGEGIGTCLEPYDDGVQFAKRANPWVVDLVVDDSGSNDEVKCSVHPMEKGDDSPGGVEAPPRLLLHGLCVMFLTRLLHPCNGQLRMRGRGQLYHVCNKQVTRNREVENEAINDVLPSVIVAVETYQHAVLFQSDKYQCGTVAFTNLPKVLNHQSQVGDNCTGQPNAGKRARNAYAEPVS